MISYNADQTLVTLTSVDGTRTLVVPNDANLGAAIAAFFGEDADPEPEPDPETQPEG